MQRKVIFVYPERCIGCKSCALSCAVAHSHSKRLEEAIYEEDKEYPRIIVDCFEGKSIPYHCRQCEDAPCIKVCPTGALTREDLTASVVLNRDKCIGCYTCIIVCPFGVIKKSRDGKKMIKCDLCLDRVKIGKEPACVDACPVGAIKFLSVGEFISEKRKDVFEKYRVFFDKK